MQIRNKELHRILHVLWTKAVGKPDYVKSNWMLLEEKILELDKKFEAASMPFRCFCCSRFENDYLVVGDPARGFIGRREYFCHTCIETILMEFVFSKDREKEKPMNEGVIREWEGEPQQPLTIPPEVLSRLHHKVSVQRLHETKPVLCWCESFEHEPMIQSLTLKYCLVDMSQRYEGITLTSRRTLFSQVQFLGQFTATVLPVGEDCC